MFGPVLDLMLDAADMTVTVVTLIALWSGRTSDIRIRLMAWLSGRPARAAEVEEFIARARSAAMPRIAADRRPPEVARRAGQADFLPQASQDPWQQTAGTPGSNS